MKLKLIIVCAVAIVFSVVISIAIAQQSKGGGFSGNSAVQGSWYANSYALVVGINSYSNGWGRLSAGVSDAQKMAVTLKSKGFKVYELYDTKATMAEIVKWLRISAQKAGPNDRFIFYYSGHGYTKTSQWDSNQVGYLVPVDGRSGDISNYLSITSIREEILSNCGAKHVLLILDSCFSGTLLTRASMNDGVVSDYLSKRGIYGITAGMQDQAAVDGLFTSVLIGGLEGNADYNNDNYVSFKELGMYAEQNVKTRNSAQTPDYGVMFGAGQFVFARAGGKNVSIPTPSTPVSVESTYIAPDTSKYEAIAQEEQERIDEKMNAEQIKLEVKKRAIRNAYSKVSLTRNSRKYTPTAMKKLYKKFLEDFPEGNNIYYRTVKAWLEEPIVENRMAFIPGGWFFMGCVPMEKNDDCEENHRKKKYVKEFYMDVHEVTVLEYRDCVDDGVCDKANSGDDWHLPFYNWSGSYNSDKDPISWEKLDRLDHPINGVNWNQANTYCHWKGKRLPTEAEFEYALRAGSDGLIYPWGNSSKPSEKFGNFPDESAKERFPKMMVINGYNDGYIGTSPVCKMKKNAFGLCDIAGNVQEWCEDKYTEDWYSTVPENFRYKLDQNSRVIRGSSYYSHSVIDENRASARSSGAPTYQFFNLGFRCCSDDKH